VQSVRICYGIRAPGRPSIPCYSIAIGYGSGYAALATVSALTVSAVKLGRWGDRVIDLVALTHP